jgi:hypothetical protein
MKTSSLFVIYSLHLSFLHPYALILVKNFTRNEELEMFTQGLVHCVHVKMINMCNKALVFALILVQKLVLHIVIFISNLLPSLVLHLLPLILLK